MQSGTWSDPKINRKTFELTFQKILSKKYRTFVSQLIIRIKFVSICIRSRTLIANKLGEKKWLQEKRRGEYLIS